MIFFFFIKCSENNTITLFSKNSRDPRLRVAEEEIGVRNDLHYPPAPCDNPGVTDLGYDAMAKYFNIVLRDQMGGQASKDVSLRFNPI